MTATAQGILFSLTDLAVKLPADAGNAWVDFPWVTEATYKGTSQSVDLYGDDAYQQTMFFNQKGEVTVKATKASMLVLEKITGGTSTSSSSNDELAVGLTAQLDPPIVTIKASARFIKDDGTTGTAILYLYKCKCAGPFDNFLTFANGKTSELQLTFNAFISTKDELNATLGTAAIGRIVLPRA